MNRQRVLDRTTLDESATSAAAARVIEPPRSDSPFEARVSVDPLYGHTDKYWCAEMPASEPFAD